MVLKDSRIKKTGHAFLTFSEALANFVPDALNARAARGLS